MSESSELSGRGFQPPSENDCACTRAVMAVQIELFPSDAVTLSAISLHPKQT